MFQNVLSSYTVTQTKLNFTSYLYLVQKTNNTKLRTGDLARSPEKISQY